MNKLQPSSSDCQHILIIRAGAFGDMVMMTALYQAIASDMSTLP